MIRTNIKPSPIGIAIIVFVLVGISYLYFRGPAREAKNPHGKILVSRLLSAAIDLAERGGRVVVDVRNEGTGNMDEKVKGITKEGKKELVTKGDMMSHRAIVRGLLKAFPDVNFVSEEHEVEHELDVDTPNMNREEVVSLAGRGPDSVPISKVSVWIDPLDATQEYEENLLQYVTVMICIAVGDEPVAAVIREPNFDDKSLPGKTSWAWVGHGTSKGMSETVKEAKKKLKENSEMNFIVSRSHAGHVEESAKQAYGSKIKITPAGGSGHKVLQVVRGNADAYVHVTCIKKWDICAGDAILRAVGGKMTKLNGDSILYSTKSGPYNDGGILAALENHGEVEGKFKDLIKSGKIEVSPCKHS